MSAGFFIVLEGIDGSGTTTQAERLAQRFRDLGRAVTLTREPTRGPVGRFLRQALAAELSDEAGPVELGWDSMALLFSADRMDHLRRQIIPALERGDVVISDRYDLSSLVYQSGTCPEGAAALPWLRSLNEKARRPDLTIVLDVPVDAAEVRRAARDEKPEIYERSELQRRLRDLYNQAPEILPGDVIEILSGLGPIERVEERIWQSILSRHPEFAKNEPERG